MWVMERDRDGETESKRGKASFISHSMVPVRIVDGYFWINRITKAQLSDGIL